MDYEFELERVDIEIKKIDEWIEMHRESARICELEKIVEKETQRIHVLTKMKSSQISSIMEVLQKRIEAEFWRKCKEKLAEVPSVMDYDLDISLELVDELLARGYCLCGKELSENEACKKEFLRLKMLIPPVSINRLIRNLYKNSKRGSENVGDITSDYYYLSKDMFLVNSELKEAQHTVSKVNLELVNSPFGEEMRRMKLRRNELVKKKEQIKALLIEEIRRLKNCAKKVGEDNDE